MFQFCNVRGEIYLYFLIMRYHGGFGPFTAYGWDLLRPFIIMSSFCSDLLSALTIFVILVVAQCRRSIKVGVRWPLCVDIMHVTWIICRSVNVTLLRNKIMNTIQVTGTDSNLGLTGRISGLMINTTYQYRFNCQGCGFLSINERVCQNVTRGVMLLLCNFVFDP